MPNNLKALFLFIDAVCPEFVIGQSHLFPNIHKLVQTGATAYFDGYTNQMFHGAYKSEDNWISIYTGLEPKQHNIKNKRIGDVVLKTPAMSEIETEKPFWKMLNQNGITTDLWAGSLMYPPTEVNGYVVSVERHFKETDTNQREFLTKLHLHEKDKKLGDLIAGELPQRLYPATINENGYKWEDFINNPELAQSYLEKNHFEESLERFEEELFFHFSNMKRVHSKYPVDVMVFFTPTIDLIGHFSLYDSEYKVLKSAYMILDKHIGDLIDELCPETVFFISDHGQQNFKDMVRCSDRQTQKEAFQNTEQVVWLPNGNIAFPARNGSILLAAHSLKGTFIASGKGIKKTELSDMRTIDIYPTILEMFDMEVPDDRLGFVQDIFDKKYVNESILLKSENIKYSKLAVIQTHSVDITDIFLNELYMQNRFCKITVIGNKKYSEIFEANPRVSSFLALEEVNLQKVAENFDHVYTCNYNAKTKEFMPLALKE